MGRLADDIAAFIASRTADGYARSTVKNYTKDLRCLQRSVGNPPTGKLTASDMDVAFALASTTQAPQSVNGMQANLAAFFKWCRARALVPADFDPLAGRRYRKVPDRAKRRVPMAQFGQLLDAADSRRDRMVLALGLYLMLRQSEIGDLRVGDINLGEGIASCRIFKTGDVDDMPISSELDRELRSWLTYYAQSCGPLDPKWFLTPARHARGGRERNELGQWQGEGVLNPTAKMTHIEDVAQKALVGIGWNLRDSTGKSEWHGMHTLRRSSARGLFDELASSGYDGALRTVQAMLHHKNSTMTERYLGLEIDRAVRNKKFTGQPLFGSLASEKIVQLGVVTDGKADDLAV